MKRKKFLPLRWRKRYNYICQHCQHKRTTLDHDRMLTGICVACEPKKTDPNQLNLLEVTA